MMVQKILSAIATLGPVGYLPAPGTMGSLTGILMVMAVRLKLHLFPWLSEQLVLLIVALVAIWVIEQARGAFVGKDPQMIVLDEVVGIFVVFFGLPLHPIVVLIGFAYFRLFDIYKPLGIASLETLPGAWGIVADDVAAGVIAHVLLTLTLQLLF